MTDDDTYLPIRAVTRLTGINDHTLRKWESRYALVVPTRSETGRRLYSSADVERLLIVRDLLEQGFQPSQLADLDASALQALRQPTARARLRPPSGPLAVTVVGHILNATLRAAPETVAKALDVTPYPGNLNDWLTAGGSDGNTLIECASLQPGLAKRIIRQRRSATGVVVLVYGFASSSTVAELAEAGILCRKAPLTAQELVTALTLPLPAAEFGELLERTPPVRRFNDAEIAALARASPAIDCECPAHIAQLLSSINAFEQYSQECSDIDPDERALHQHIARVAGVSRALFENAMQHIVEAEGIDLAELLDNGRA
jgi:DNA-binding transcriptional MerR regulator